MFVYTLNLSIVIIILFQSHLLLFQNLSFNSRDPLFLTIPHFIEGIHLLIAHIADI